MSLENTLLGSIWNKNTSLRKSIYSIFKIKCWNVDLDCIFDPLIEHNLEVLEDIESDSDDETYKEPRQQRQKKTTLSRFNVDCLLSRSSNHKEKVNLIHELLVPLDLYSSFFAVSAEIGKTQMTTIELARHIYLEELKREENLDKVSLIILDSVKDRAPLLHSFFEDWLDMLRETQHHFSKLPGVGEQFYEEFFTKFLCLYGFETRRFKLPSEEASRCCFQLDKHLRNVLQEKWPKKEENKFFFIKKIREIGGRNPELVAVVKVKVPIKIGQWGIKEDIFKMSETHEKKDEKDAKKDKDLADTEKEKPIASGLVDDEDSHDLEDRGHTCVTPSVACHELDTCAKQVMKRYVPQLLGELISNFHENTVFKKHVFTSPYRLGVAVIGFKVQFVGMRFSKKAGKPGDDNRNVCPEKVILDKRLQTDLFFSEPLDILNKNDRKAIIDVLCAAEAIPTDVY